MFTQVSKTRTFGNMLNACEGSTPLISTPSRVLILLGEVEFCGGEGVARVWRFLEGLSGAAEYAGRCPRVRKKL